ncbi:MAG: NUDIX domain-containing protein [Oscillospiraceae bacterium]|nr:NUDIX domain-containing protein [Oscillospiraceae bacterium]
MGPDLTMPVEGGLVNLRVGAIIRKDGKLLMVGNATNDYDYSVGGRIRFGETAEEAVVREVEEETGCRLEIDRLGFIEENFFYGTSPFKREKLVYEISFYFYMKTPAGFEPLSDRFEEEGTPEHLEWLSPDTEKTIYPAFFRTELAEPVPYVRHIVSDERI